VVSYFEKIGGTGRTDRQTDAQHLTLNPARREGRV